MSQFMLRNGKMAVYCYDRDRDAMQWRSDVFDGYETLPCFWCDAQLEMRLATVDHLKPKSRGGKSRDENMVVSCYDCNQRRAIVSRLAGRVRHALQNINGVDTYRRKIVLNAAIQERNRNLDLLLDLEALYHERLEGKQLRWCLGELDEVLRA